MDHNRRTAQDSRSHTAVSTRRSAGFSKSESPIHGGAVMVNDRIGTLLMEANEISQYLQKDYVFTKADETLTDDAAMFVKVVNNSDHVSCLWPLSKLKEKLVKMRKLVYAPEGSNGTGSAVDSIFTDSNDKWQPEPILSTSDDSMTSISVTSSQQSDPVLLSKASSLEERVLPSQGIACSARAGSTNGSHGNNGGHFPVDFGELAADTQFVPVGPGCSLPDDSSRLTGSGRSTFRANQSETVPFPLPVDSLRTKSPTFVPRIKEPLRVDRSLHQVTKSAALHTKQIRDTHCVAYTQTDATSPATQTDIAVRNSVRTCGTQTVEDLAHCNADFPSTDVIVKLCKIVAEMSRTRFTVGNSSGSRVERIDRVLQLCESIRQGLHVIIKAELPESNHLNVLSGCFVESFTTEVICVQLVVAVDLLVNTVDIWSLEQTGNSSSPAVGTIRRNLMQIVKELSRNVVVFWQACESQMEVMIQDSLKKVTDLLLELTSEAGKLAVIDGVCPQALIDQKRMSFEQLLMQQSTRPDDLLSLEPGIEVKQGFLSGCDIMVVETLQECLKALDDNEDVLASSADCCEDASSISMRQELLRSVFIVLTTCKLLLVRLQEIQVVLDSAVKENTDKPMNYHHYYFERCVAVMSGAHKLVDSITLLIRAVESFHKEIYSDLLRRICRCSEMVQKATRRLSRASSTSKTCFASSSNVRISAKRLSLDLSSFESSDSGGSPVTVPAISGVGSLSGTGFNMSDSFTLLLPSQTESLQQAIESASQATEELGRIIKQKLAQEKVLASASTSLAVGVACTQGSKRMLPVVPGSQVTGSAVIVRCQSARSSDLQSSALSKHISLQNFPSKRSNEI